MTEVYLIALANAVICGICWFICICRLNSMRSRPRVRYIVRLEYALGVGAMLLSAGRPLIGEWPGYASLGVSLYVLLALIASGPAWRGDDGDEPPEVATEPASLGYR